MGDPRFNIIYSFSLFYGLLSKLGLLLRTFCFLCFASAVRSKLYYNGDEPNIELKLNLCLMERSSSIGLNNGQNKLHRK